MLHRTVQQFLTDVFFGDLDVLLIDMPPGTGDVAISVGQLLPHADVLVVTTPQTAASDVAVRSFRQTGQRVIGVVENMAAMTLPTAPCSICSARAAETRWPRRCRRRMPHPCRCSVGAAAVALRAAATTGVPGRRSRRRMPRRAISAVADASARPAASSRGRSAAAHPRCARRSRLRSPRCRTERRLRDRTPSPEEPTPWR
jgi:ATP-binding protein involved in chromosome partitioning